MSDYISLKEAANLIGKSKETLRRWDREGKLSAAREPISNYRVYKKKEFLTLFSNFIEDDNFNNNSNEVTPIKSFSAIELFAGAGGACTRPGKSRHKVRCFK